MSTKQGVLKIPRRGGEYTETCLYLTLRHTGCKTGRTFKIRASLAEVIICKQDGIFIQSHCPKCGCETRVDIYRAENVAQGFSYKMPTTEDEIILTDTENMGSGL